MEDVFSILFEPLGNHAFSLKRPTVPFWDPVNRTMIRPFRITARYLRELTSAQISCNDLRTYLEPIHILARDNQTIHQYLVQWNLALQPLGTNYQALVEECEVQGEKLERRKKLLLALITRDCCERLREQWHLSPEQFPRNAAVEEILTLLHKQFLSRKDLATMLFEANLTPIANRMDQELDRLGRLCCLENLVVLPQYNHKLEELNAFETWFTQAISQEAPLPPDQLLLDLGNLKNSSDKNISLNLNQVPDCMLEEVFLQLWLAGVDMDWRAYFIEGQYLKACLPTYKFDRQSFWYKTATTNPVEAEPDQEIKQEPQPEPVPLLESPAADLKQKKPVLIAGVGKQLDRLLKSIFARRLDLDTQELQTEAGFVDEYGIDSFLNQELIEDLNQHFEDIPATLLFECTTLHQLSQWLLENRQIRLSQMFAGQKLGIQDLAPKTGSEPAQRSQPAEKTNRNPTSRTFRNQQQSKLKPKNQHLMMVLPKEKKSRLLDWQVNSPRPRMFINSGRTSW